MIRRGVKIQLVAFAAIAILAIGYAVIRFAGAGNLFHPPYTVHVHFADAAGIEPKDEVDELGVPVGSVSALHPDGNSVIVDLSLHHGVRIPATGLTAAIADKSALGEQYVALTPHTTTGPVLTSGATIGPNGTSEPVPLQDILSNLDQLAKSVPKHDLTVDLQQAQLAFGGTGSDLQRLLDDGNLLTRSALNNLGQTVSLINSSNKVLATQVDEAHATQQFATALAGFTREARSLDPDLAGVFVNGLRTGREVTTLLRGTETSLPDLLNGLVTTTAVAHARLPQLRKTLTLYPWVVQVGATAVRYCDDYNLKTGKPVQKTCHIDPKTGQRIYTGHFAFQTPQPPGTSPYNPCTKGYGGTTKYLPNGDPVSGHGPKETNATKPNRNASCTALPTDPSSPNVRGSQNAQRPAGDNSVNPARSHGARSSQVISQREFANGMLTGLLHLFALSLRLLI